ncbi:MAG: phosphoribosylanthranilate isomerase [Prevotella sp.]|nr:phosphoribosylanthranilate isomerase [Prevotella sp.]
MIIKVCGMRDPENIRAVSELDIQWLGMIFWEKSSRNVSKKPSYLPTKQKRVGVFVDATIEEVMGKVQEYTLDIIQLHGKESPAYIQTLRPLCGDRVAAIIKALNIATKEDLEQTKPYMDVVDYFLFDTKAKMVGGNGTKFDWSVLTEYKGTTPFILSGGIGPDDADKVKAFHHPQLAGIDLNSRFETAPAHKDVNALRDFLSSLAPLNPLNP